MEDEQGALDVLSIPERMSIFTRLEFDPTATLRASISARAYCMGRRVMSDPGTELALELNSMIASPSFYNSAQYSDVLFKQTVGDGPEKEEVYKLGQVRVMFSLAARSLTRGGAAIPKPPPPVKFALVHLYDRHRVTLSLGSPPSQLNPHTALYGGSITDWKPTVTESEQGSCCISLRQLPAWGTMVIPLSWVVQVVHVVPDCASTEPDRFLLNRWHWSKLG